MLPVFPTGKKKGVPGSLGAGNVGGGDTRGDGIKVILFLFNLTT